MLQVSLVNRQFHSLASKMVQLRRVVDGFLHDDADDAKVANELDDFVIIEAPMTLLSLPDELLLDILSYLDPRSVINVTQVCTRLNDITMDQTFEKCRKKLIKACHKQMENALEEYRWVPVQTMTRMRFPLAFTLLIFLAHATPVLALVPPPILVPILLKASEHLGLHLGKRLAKFWTMRVEKRHPLWQKEKITTCPACNADFGLFVRRHHCRCCKLIYCGKCVTNKTVLSKYGYSCPVLVCNDCYLLKIQGQLPKSHALLQAIFPRQRIASPNQAPSETTLDGKNEKQELEETDSEEESEKPSTSGSAAIDDDFGGSGDDCWRCWVCLHMNQAEDAYCHICSAAKPRQRPA